jgi:hypothetical protein
MQRVPLRRAGAEVGRCALTPPDPQLKGAWYPGGFNPRTYQVENRFQNVPFKVATCTATQSPAAANDVFRKNEWLAVYVPLSQAQGQVGLYKFANPVDP